MPTVLIAEDEAPILRMFETVFKSNGFEVRTAVNGQDCIDVLKTATPDIILLDILMPEVDGLAALHQIKQNPATKNIPVVMLTNQADDSKTKEAIEAGADTYILKSDVDPHDLVKMVQTMLTMGGEQRSGQQSDTTQPPAA